MSELTEELWAVLSERGTEATALTYAQATEVMRSLLGEKVSGLSIITNDAARRATPDRNPQSGRTNSNGARKIRQQ
jgi:hypothetical protein